MGVKFLKHELSLLGVTVSTMHFAMSNTRNEDLNKKSIIVLL